MEPVRPTGFTPSHPVSERATDASRTATPKPETFGTVSTGPNPASLPTEAERTLKPYGVTMLPDGRPDTPVTFPQPPQNIGDLMQSEGEEQS